jgi:hypothetical protein
MAFGAAPGVCSRGHRRDVAVPRGAAQLRHVLLQQLHGQAQKNPPRDGGGRSAGRGWITVMEEIERGFSLNCFDLLLLESSPYGFAMADSPGQCLLAWPGS